MTTAYTRATNAPARLIPRPDLPTKVASAHAKSKATNARFLSAKTCTNSTGHTSANASAYPTRSAISTPPSEDPQQRQIDDERSQAQRRQVVIPGDAPRSEEQIRNSAGCVAYRPASNDVVEAGVVQPRVAKKCQ